MQNDRVFRDLDRVVLKIPQVMEGSGAGGVADVPPSSPNRNAGGSRQHCATRAKAPLIHGMPISTDHPCNDRVKVGQCGQHSIVLHVACAEGGAPCRGTVGRQKVRCGCSDSARRSVVRWARIERDLAQRFVRSVLGPITAERDNGFRRVGRNGRWPARWNEKVAFELDRVG